MITIITNKISHNIGLSKTYMHTRTAHPQTYTTHTTTFLHTHLGTLAIYIYDLINQNTMDHT